MSRSSYINNLTLLINTFNEEKNIPNILKSLKRINNIVIVDSYSNDKTIGIARKYTKKIYFNKFINFENQRNYSLSKIKSLWILMMDADEVLSEGAYNTINKLIKNKNIDGYWFPRRNYINSKYYLKFGYFYPDWQL